MLTAQHSVFFFSFFHDWRYSFNPTKQGQKMSLFLWSIILSIDGLLTSIPDKSMVSQTKQNSFSGQAWTTGSKSNITLCTTKYKDRNEERLWCHKDQSCRTVSSRKNSLWWSDLSHLFLWGWIWIHRFLFWAVPLYTLDLKVCKRFQKLHFWNSSQKIFRIFFLQNRRSHTHGLDQNLFKVAIWIKPCTAK